MKTIELTDEMYEFLINLSKELNIQDNRCTASPYFFQIQEEKLIPTGEGMGNEIWVHDDIVLRNENDIKEAIFDYKEWNVDNEEHQKMYNELSNFDIDDILEENFIKHYETTQLTYQNAFITEKACKEHIRLNSYNYTNPVDYLSHAFRNPELEKLLNFIKKLTV